MKETKNFILMTIALMLLSMQSAFAWTTRPGSNGWHPELLAQASCAYSTINYYQSDSYNDHAYTGSINGMAIVGNGSGGANTNLGIDGNGFYEANGLKYFIGRLVETVKVLHREGRDSTTTTAYKYQICSVGSTAFSYYGYENSTSACPAATPSGAIYIQRSYEVWTDGSVRNYTAWYETSRTCAAVYQSTETGYQYLACSTNGGAYTEGGNGITQSRTRQIWSDGAKAWSGWTTNSNTCYKTVTDVQAQKTYACAEGQTGKIVKEPRRTHIEYATDASKTQAEKDALNEKNSTAWTEYTISNTCTNVPDRTWTEAGTKSVTCESVKGSGYTGTAIQTGTYTYTYSSVTKQTTSSFSPTSTDTSSCSNATTDVAMETQTKACPSGQTGSITEYRYVATDSTGAKTYPQGTAYQTLNNTCLTNDTATDNSTVNTDTSVTEGLLSNSTLKTSDSSSVNAFTNFTKNINVSTLGENNYKLNLVVDSMVTSYSTSNVSNAINAFNNKINSAGKTSEITINLPKDLSKYGQLKDTTGKSFKKAILNRDGTATITYEIAGKGLGKNTVETFNVNVLQGVNDISNISVN